MAGFLFVTIATAQHDTAWVRRVYGTGNGDDRVVALAAGPTGDIYAVVQNLPDDTSSTIITARYSSDGTLLWSRRFGVGKHVVPVDIAVDADGNALVVGTSEIPMPDSIVTIKYSSTGDSCWVRYYNTEGNNDMAADVLVDGAGNVYVAGTSETDDNYEDMLLVKYSSSGEELWVRLYDYQQNEDFGLAAVIDQQGYIYEVGSVCNWQAGGDYDMQVLKYSPAGALVWARTFRGPGENEDSATCVAVDPQNNVVVAGCTNPDIWDSGYLVVKYTPAGETLWSRSFIGEGEENGAVAVETDNQSNVIVAANDEGDRSEFDYLVVKYSPTGDELWRRRYNTEEDYCEKLAGMRLDAEGNIYLTGTTEAPGGGGKEDVATMKYSPSGESLWARRWAAPDLGFNAAWGTALALTPAGPCVGGHYRHWGRDTNALLLQYDSSGSELWEQRLAGPGQRNWNGDGADDVAFDPEGNVIAVGHLDMTGEGWDLAVAKYSPAGELLWLRTYHNLECHEDAATAVATDSWGNVYVTGYSEGDGTGFDYVTLKYDSEGNQCWVNRYNGPADDDDKPNALAVDRSGNVAVAGQSYGVGTGPDFATVRYTSFGGELWIRRYNGSESLGDNAVSVAVDREGATYVSGTTREADYTSPATVIKYDMSGTVVWTTHVPEPPPRSRYFGVAGMCLDQDGFCYLGGEGYYGFLAAKLTPAGETLWVRCAELPDECTAAATAVSEDGRVYVTGYIGWDSTFYMTVGFGPDGEELWRQSYGEGEAGASDVICTSDGRVFVTGVAHWREIVTLGYDSSGNQIWLDRYGPGRANALGRRADRLAVAGEDWGFGGPYFVTLLYEPRIGLAEPSRLPHPVGSPGLRAYPNPFSGSVRFGVQKHRAGRVRLEVYDRAGRLVRTLADRVGGAEVKHCEWDGLDAAGQPVPDGVYFVELRVQDGAPGRDAPTRVATVKVVKAR
jgi:uncharacterized delta-60 repeat protein